MYKKIRRAVLQKSGKVYNGNHYRHPRVTAGLKLLYHEKCSYCESKTEHVAILQVEHYRPKDGLYEEPGHQGYYWLGCEWSNLLLGCPKCNGAGAKGTRFPIKGVRVFEQDPFNPHGEFNRVEILAPNSPLADEKPLILNPEQKDFNPVDHFMFNHIGEMEGITEEGKTTIEVCNLNRKPLIRVRMQKLDELLENIQIAIHGFKSEIIDETGLEFLLKTTFNKIKHRQSPENEYAFWGWFMFENFELCFISKLEPAYQDLIRQAFREFYTGNS